MDEVTPHSRDFHVWQQARILDLTPVIVLDVLYMLFGVVGNSIVCYICLFRLQRTVINSFVLSLAILELLGCILIIPVDITELLNSYALNFPLLCKSEKYFRKVIIFSTGCILVAIATERYKRIVKPHGRHMTLCEFRLAIVGAVVVSAIIAIPEAILSGNETVQTSFGTGVVCSAYTSDKYQLSVYPKLWGLVVVIIYVLSITAITIFYCMIAFKIWKRGKVHTDRRSRSNTPDTTLQRRVRCYSYHQRRSEELDSIKKSRASLHFQQHFEQDLISMHRFQERNNSTLYHLCTLPRVKNNKTTEKSSQRIQEENGSEQQKVDMSNSLNQYNDVNHGHNSGNSTKKIQVNYDVQVPSHTQCDSEDLHYRRDINKRTNNNETFITIQHLKNNCDNNCQAKCNHQHIDRKEDKSHQESLTQSTAFMDAVVNKLNDTQHIDRLQSRYRYLYGNPQDFHRPASPSFHHNLGYSRKRTTFIMFIMTLTTAFSHLPHIIVMLYSLTHPGVAARLTSDVCVIFHIAWNSFFISLATHPFMYGFWNGRFKAALCGLLTGFTLRKAKTEKDSCSSGRQA